MLSIFKNQGQSLSSNMKNFEYLDSKSLYFDTACQTLRPQQVIAAENQYYHEFNSCGHRVKYKWGEKTDSLVEETRLSLLNLVAKSSKEYSVAFGLNTTTGINQVLHQLPEGVYAQIVTSEIEHNSVFLPSITWAKKYDSQRLVLPRAKDGSLEYTLEQLTNSVVIVNTTSNIDGRNLSNLKQLAKDVRRAGGLLLLDACQSFAHNPEILLEVDFDAAFGSGHKMYGPSVGFTIIKNELLRKLDCFLIGGSTVQDVGYDSYDLIDTDSELYARIEPGLQNYAGIIGLGESLRWKKQFTGVDGLKAIHYEKRLTDYLHNKLSELKGIVLLNDQPSPIVSLYSEKIDSHKFGMYLAQKDIMCRTGYHCCHYYLKEKLNLPPLLRISLGLNNTIDQIDTLIETMNFVLRYT